MGRGPSDPFRDLLSLQERMNQLFEESARRSGLRPHVDQWTPLVDILDTDHAIILTAEVPGLEIGDITLEVTNHYLTLRGERLFPHSEGNTHYHQLERAYGKFERLFHLPEEVDQARINATLRDGVLEIVLPKQPSQHAYTISVTTPEP
jgi:HSP20 family protein